MPRRYPEYIREEAVKRYLAGKREVSCGCFNGTLDEFRSKVKETHGDNQYAREYLAIADIAETRFGKEKDNVTDRS